MTVTASKKKYLALSGGVGGAKLALGLSKQLAPQQLTLVANTADDFEHLGLSISPDLDTVMYTLAGLNNKEQGWGLAGESWNTMGALAGLGGETWFRLGDKDLATHLQRSTLLSSGESLSSVTRLLCQQLGIQHPIIPMSDDVVRTRVHTQNGELAFQQYFVREQCAPAVTGFHFDGIDTARPQQQLMDSLSSEDLAAIIICPSNPFVSVDPILALSGVREAMQNSAAPVIAVSPIVAGMAIKGPAAKMMAELGMPATAAEVARFYDGLIDGFVLDQSDLAMRSSIEDTGVRVHCGQTIMTTLQNRIDLAAEVLAFAETFNGKNNDNNIGDL